ncbi:hypothetical protein [Photorhabdus kleinii]|nr:hypothetical protein [Photorhabdus kleinii]
MNLFNGISIEKLQKTIQENAATLKNQKAFDAVRGEKTAEGWVRK